MLCQNQLSPAASKLQEQTHEKSPYKWMDSGANIFISQNRLSDLIDQITRCDKETADGDKNREASTFARSLLTRPVLSESDAFQVSPLLPIQSMEVPRDGYSHLIKQMIKVQESMGTGKGVGGRLVGWAV